MGSRKVILAIDQGTTSTKALVIDQAGTILGSSLPDRFTIEADYPQPGWVEFDPWQLAESVRRSAETAVHRAGVDQDEIAGIGLANQGETVIAFDAETGQPIYPAISWQDCRTEPITSDWSARGLQDSVHSTTGLRLDPYFSAAKWAWIMEHVSSARDLQAAGRLRLGTSDAWLLWQLTGGQQFVTDVSTASRTMLMDLSTLDWSPQLADSLGIAVSDLPRIVPNAEPIGVTSNTWCLPDVPITGLCVDQQAALFGHGALDSGQAKITYGTGCFLLANAGSDPKRRAPGLLTSVGWHIGNETAYVFDGGVYSAGSLVDWLCRLGLADDIQQLAELALAIDAPSPVMLIPAFSGLAAPRWSSRTRACWLGMDPGTDRSHLARSAFEAIAFRVKEIHDVMHNSGIPSRQVTVDGGLSGCDVLMQIQADVLDLSVARNSLSEFTALGAGYLAGLGCGLWQSPRQLPHSAVETIHFEPQASVRRDYANAFAKWQRACSAAVQMGEDGLF